MSAYVAAAMSGTVRRGLLTRMGGEDSDSDAVEKARSIWGAPSRAPMALRSALDSDDADDDDGDFTRGNWPSDVEFLLAAMGCAIGIGNIWRFPWLISQYGGSFLVAYWTLYFLVAFPAFVFELLLGQFCSRGPVHIYRHLCPLLQGVGWGHLYIQLGNVLQYSGLFSISIFLMFSSIQSPWRSCDLGTTWATHACFSASDYVNCVRGNASARWFVKGRCYDNDNISLLWRQLENDLHEDTAENEDCSFSLKLELGGARGWHGWASLFRGGGCGDGRLALFGAPQRDKCDMVGSGSAWDAASWTPNISAPLNVSLNLGSGSETAVANRACFAEVLGRVHPDCAESSTCSSLGQLMAEYCGSAGNVSCARAALDPWPVFAAEEYLSYNTASGGVTEMRAKGMNPLMGLCLLLAWILTALGVWQGVNLVGKVSVVTAGFPFIMIVILLIVSLTLEGHQLGIDFYLRPCRNVLGNATLWIDALTQIYYSNSLGSGEIITLASYNEFNNDVIRDAMVISFSNSVFSFLSGVGIFGVAGYMSALLDVGVQSVVREPESLVWVVLSEATGTLPGGQALSFFFFLMINLLAIDCCFAMIETILTYVYDDFPVMRRFKPSAVSLLCAAAFFLSLPFVTRVGLPTITMLDTTINVITVPAFALCALITVFYIYGIGKFFEDIHMMMGVTRFENKRHFGSFFFNSPLKWYMFASWMCFAPVGIFCIFVTSFFTKLKFENTFEDIFILFMGILSVVVVPGMGAGLELWKGAGLRASLRPTSSWGPAIGGGGKAGSRRSRHATSGQGRFEAAKAAACAAEMTPEPQNAKPHAVLSAEDAPTPDDGSQSLATTQVSTRHPSASADHSGSGTATASLKTHTPPP